MEGTMTLNNPVITMPNTKAMKKEVMTEIKNKLEAAKVNLVYVELEEANVQINHKYSTVKELLSDCKNSLSQADYEIVKEVVKKVEASLDGMVNELEEGSTNAFTKVMTSDLSKSIAKGLGISLAARTALILAPTPLSKAAVGLGLAGYSVYKLAKNRKEVKKINESNEYNNILMDLETTKEDDNVVDTRFSKEVQERIREFFKNNRIKFEDTGYRSLRQAMYSLDVDNKKKLCEFLNSYLNKEIDIDARIKKVDKNLNVISTTSAMVGSGVALAGNAAAVANAVAPEAVTGLVGGLGLEAWISSITNKGWFGKLIGGLGGIGVTILGNLPILGGPIKQLCASLNLATFTAVGAVGGFAVSLVVEAIALAKRAYNYSKNKKESHDFLTLDSEKYSQEDQTELLEIAKNMKQSSNVLEQTIVDVVYDYLIDEGIDLGTKPKSIKALRNSIKQLNKKDQAKAQKMLSTISDAAKNDPTFLSQIMKAGKITTALATAGLAGLSIYDIIKGGTFLPELSYRLFPENNMYAPMLNMDPEFVNEVTQQQAIDTSQEQVVGTAATTDASTLPPEILTEQQEYYDILIEDALNIEPVNQTKEEFISALVRSRVENLVGDDLEKFVTFIQNMPAPTNSDELAVYQEILNQFAPKTVAVVSEVVPDATVTFTPMEGLNTTATRVEEWHEKVENLQKLNQGIGVATTANVAVAGILNSKEKNLDYMFEINEEEINQAEQNTINTK